MAMLQEEKLQVANPVGSYWVSAEMQRSDSSTNGSSRLWISRESGRKYGCCMSESKFNDEYAQWAM